MAIAIKTKDDVQIFMGEQTTWGTALAASADFNTTTPEFGTQLSCELAAIDWDTKIRTPNRSNSGRRTMDRLNIQHDSKGSMPKITINGDALQDDLPAFLYAVFQNVSEAAGSPYEKTYTFGSTQPDFTAGAGWFGTIIVQDSNSSSVNKLLRDCICRKLTLTCDPESNQGRLQISAEMISRGGATLNLAQVSGSVAQGAPTECYYFHDINVFTGNGNALAPTSIKIELENNARPVSVDGTTAGWFRSYALGPYSVKATFRVLYEANAQAIQALQATTIDHAWVLSWGTDNGQGYLNFAINAQPGPAQDINEDTKDVEFVLTGVYNAGTLPITVVAADAIDRAW